MDVSPRGSGSDQLLAATLRQLSHSSDCAQDHVRDGLGREIMITWEPSTSVIVAPAR